jgi:tetratricopeptide (TPR) repeat protein
VAWFKRKTEPQNNGEGKGEAVEFQPQPEKARKWFEHGRSAADTANFGYALACFANCVRLDPESMSSHEAMLEAAIKYMNKQGDPATRDELRAVGDNSPVGRFAAAEFAWMKDIRNPILAVKALDAAVAAGQREWGHWVAPRILNLVFGQKKTSKGALLQLVELFKEVSAWDEAIRAGEMALQLDPSDSKLSHSLKDLAAQRAMDQGGYEQTAGEEGGFRKFIKDADRQRELQESDAITTTQSIEDRNLERAKVAYEANPLLPDAINQYGQQLKKRGTPEFLEQAHSVYMKGYETTGEYRFRMLAGDIRVEDLARKVRRLAEKLEGDGQNEAMRAEHEAARQQLFELQASEYQERVEKYPTDRFRKFELGQVLYELGRYEEAMEQFQSAKEEPKLRVRSAHMLGRCFAEENWHPEAIAEYKEALGAIDVLEKDSELSIRYDLMVSLIALAREEQSIDLAKEALGICSGIARRNITYRDIRGKRKEIDGLIRDLNSDSAAG